MRRADQCNAFLVRFDLAKLELPPKARVAKATVSFYVWDPSSTGKTKVCAFPLKTAWDEATVTWREPAVGKSWQGGKGFAFGADAGPAGPAVVVQPDEGSDTVDPPIEYQLDVTDLVRSWLDGGAPNHGLAIAPVIDPSVDEGYHDALPDLRLGAQPGAVYAEAECHVVRPGRPIMGVYVSAGYGAGGRIKEAVPRSDVVARGQCGKADRPGMSRRRIVFLDLPIFLHEKITDNRKVASPRSEGLRRSHVPSTPSHREASS